MTTILDRSRPGVGSPSLEDREFPVERAASRLEKLLRREPIGLPEVSEVDAVRHYTGLSRNSHGVDNGAYPLGSCTMKYNPKRNDVVAELSGFRDVHPWQPAASIPGLWQLYAELEDFLAEITGMDAVSLQPAAGAHGELTGLLVIRKYFEQKSESRNVIIIQDSAHGTNPASASMAGFKCRIVPTTAEGLIDIDALRAAVDENVAAMMLTNPSTLGLFEERIETVAEIVHAAGALLYYDGANLNALMGIVRPGDMGFDLVHVNTHKTLSTPHGAGGPGAGPVGVKSFLAAYLPVPVVVRGDGEVSLSWDRAQSIGPVKAFFGHVAVLIRAYAYIRTCGPEGLKTASENAVLNANYLQARLGEFLPPVYKRLSMHECLLSGELLKVDSLDFAKRLIDYGIHPPTMVGAGCVYFPGDLRSAMLIEPTESESKQELDKLISVFEQVIRESSVDPEMVQTAPHTRSVRRINMTTQECN